MQVTWEPGKGSQGVIGGLSVGERGNSAVLGVLSVVELYGVKIY
jgi:hypothetical protein